MRAHNSLLSRIRILTVVATTSAVLTKSSVLFVQRRNVNTQSVNVDFVLEAERDNTHIVPNYFVSSTSVLVIVPRARSRTRQHVTQEVVGSPTDSTRRRSWQLTGFASCGQVQGALPNKFAVDSGRLPSPARKFRCLTAAG